MQRFATTKNCGCHLQLLQPPTLLQLSSLTHNLYQQYGDIPVVFWDPNTSTQFSINLSNYTFYNGAIYFDMQSESRDRILRRI